MGIDTGEKLLKSEDRRSRLPPLGRPGRHDHGEAAENHGGEHATEDRLRDHQLAWQLPGELVEPHENSGHRHSRHGGRNEILREDMIRPFGVVPLFDEAPEDRPLDPGKVGVEAVTKLGGGHRTDDARHPGLARRHGEHPAEQGRSGRREILPILGGDEEVEGVLGRLKPSCRGGLADPDDPLDGAVNQEGHQVAVVGGVVDERPHFGRTEPRRRCILHHHRPRPWIPPHPPPVAEHAGKSHQRDQRHQPREHQRPGIIAEPRQPRLESRWPAHHPRIPGHRDSEPLADPEGARRRHLDLMPAPPGRQRRRFTGRREGILRAMLLAVDGDRHRPLRRPVAPGEGVDADVLDRPRQADPRPRRADGIRPLVASDVPVELVVVVEKLQRPADAVADDDGADGIGRSRHPDLEIVLLALPRPRHLESLPRFVGDAEQIQPQAVIFAAGIDIPDRNPPVDAVPFPREPQPDRLGHLDQRRLGHADRSVEILDDDRPILPLGRRSEEDDPEQHQPPRSQGATLEPAEQPPHECLASVPAHDILTLGTARSAESLISKNSRGRAPAAPARRFQGNSRTDVFSSRTEAL